MPRDMAGSGQSRQHHRVLLASGPALTLPWAPSSRGHSAPVQWLSFLKEGAIARGAKWCSGEASHLPGAAHLASHGAGIHAGLCGSTTRAPGGPLDCR